MKALGVKGGEKRRELKLLRGRPQRKKKTGLVINEREVPERLLKR